MRKSNAINSKDRKKSVVLMYIVAAIFMGATILGVIFNARLNTGYFSPTIDSSFSSRGIGISESLESEGYSTRKIVNSSLDILGVTYTTLNLEEILKSEGQFIDPENKYLAYSFYVKNIGYETVNIDYYMRITQMFFWMEDYISILIIEDDLTYRLYQKGDQPILSDNTLNDNDVPKKFSFESDTIVFRDSFTNFKPGSVKLFRVIIWLEEDVDIKKQYESGHANFVLVFDMRDPHQDSGFQPKALSNATEEMWISSSICTVELSVYYESDEASNE